MSRKFVRIQKMALEHVKFEKMSKRTLFLTKKMEKTVAI